MKIRTSGGSSKYRFLRFLLAGLVNALAGYGLFLLYFWVLGIHYLVANIFVFATWAWFGYEIQRHFVFGGARRSKAFARYVANQVYFMAVGTGILALLVDFAQIRPEVAYIIVLGMVTLGLYVTSRFLVFTGSSK